MSRTRKRPKTGAKAVDKSCRNHGECPWCRGNRTHGTKRRKLAVLERLEEALRAKFEPYDEGWEEVKGESRSL